MYKIIGANQVEYGPITADQLRAWIAEGRVNAQTPVQAQGDTTWKPLSMFPEFASALPATPPPVPAPLGAAVTDDGRARALSMISGPAIGLIVTAILGLLVGLLNLCKRLFFSAVLTMPGFADSSQDADAQRALALVNGAGGIILFVLAIILWGIVLWGALKMKKLESYGLSIAASIIAMVPCVCPCCLLGIPFGIWALVVLNKPEVKQYFS